MCASRTFGWSRGAWCCTACRGRRRRFEPSAGCPRSGCGTRHKERKGHKEYEMKSQIFFLLLGALTAEAAPAGPIPHSLPRPGEARPSAPARGLTKPGVVLTRLFAAPRTPAAGIATVGGRETSLPNGLKALTQQVHAAPVASSPV